MNAAVELGVVLIDEIKRTLSAEPGHRLTFAIGLVFAGRPLVPVVDIEELGIAREGLVPAFLKVNAVMLGMLDRLAEPGHIGRNGQVVLVELRFARCARPRFPDADRIGPAHRHRMLGRRHGSLLAPTVMRRKQLFGLQGGYLRIGHVVAETPVVLRTDETLASPLVVAPPHRAQREKVLHLGRVIFVYLLRIVRIAVMRIGRIRHRVRIVVGIGIRIATLGGIDPRTAVVEQQRLAVPLEP